MKLQNFFNNDGIIIINFFLAKTYPLKVQHIKIGPPKKKIILKVKDSISQE